MKKLLLYFILFFLFFNIEGNSDEILPVKENFEEVFNVGTMISHDDKLLSALKKFILSLN